MISVVVHGRGAPPRCVCTTLARKLVREKVKEEGSLVEFYPTEDIIHMLKCSCRCIYTWLQLKMSILIMRIVATTRASRRSVQARSARFRTTYRHLGLLLLDEQSFGTIPRCKVASRMPSRLLIG